METTKRSVVVTPKFMDDATIAFLRNNSCSVNVISFPEGKTDATATESELVELLAEADGWILGHANVTLSLLQRLPKLKVIARRGVGFEKVDLDAVAKTKKAATIAAGGNEECVADHTLALMLSVAHRFRESQQEVVSGTSRILLGNDLYAKTVGIIGLGRIARKVIKRLKGFDVNVLVSTPRADPAFGETMGVQYVDLETLLRRSDYVSVHAPYSPVTKHLINAEKLALMKAGAVLINTARGGLVDDRALLQALKSGAITGAGLDVYESELDSRHAGVTQELASLPNVVATPHSGASTQEGLQRTNAIAARCVVSVLDGKAPPAGCLIAGGIQLKP